MFKPNQNRDKKSFQKGMFFGLGIMIAGLSYAVVASLTIKEKEDDANYSLMAAEFNQFSGVLQGIRIDDDDDDDKVGIGIDPTEKLHVAGNILATGSLTVNGNIGLSGEVDVEGTLSAHNLRSKCEEGFVLQGFNQTTGDLVCVSVEQ